MKGVDINHMKKCPVQLRNGECTGTAYIPPLPQRIIKLYIIKSEIHEVQRTIFKNLTHNRIKTLIMYKNGFTYISHDAFAF